MKTTPLLALLLCAGLAPACWSRPADDDFNSSLNEIRAQTRENKPAAAAALPASESLRGPEPACMTFGSRTESIPTWTRAPLEKACKEDPLKDAAAVQAAFTAVSAKVRAEDTRRPAGPFEDYFPQGSVHFESGIGRGSVDPEKMDALNHWGDVAVVHLKQGKDGGMSVVGGKLTTIRANKMPGRSELEAHRVDCNYNADGTIRSAQESEGLRMGGADRMSWIGPTRSPNTEQDLAGWWTIKCHQLLKAWADSTAGTASKPQ